MRPVDAAEAGLDQLKDLSVHGFASFPEDGRPLKTRSGDKALRVLLFSGVGQAVN